MSTRRLGFKMLLVLPLLAACSIFEEDKGPVAKGVRIALSDDPAARIAIADIAVPSLPSPVAQGTWLQVAGNIGRNSGHLAHAGGYTRQWSSSIGDGNDDGLTLVAQPVSDGTTIYAMDTESMLSATSLTNGARKWEVELAPENEEADEVSGGGLAMVGDTLIAATIFGEVISLSAVDGGVNWRTNIGIPLANNPLLIGDFVVVQALNGQATALDLLSGTVSWVEIGAPAGPSHDRIAAAAGEGDFVVHPGIGGEFVGIRLLDGGRIFIDFPTTRRSDSVLDATTTITASPLILPQGVLVATRNGHTSLLSKQTGARIWSLPFGLRDTPVVAGDVAFMLDQGQRLRAVSLAQGKLFWTKTMQRFEDEEDLEDPINWFGPLLVNGKLLLVSDTGLLELRDVNNGEVLGRQDIEEAAMAPIFVNGLMLLLSQSGNLVAYR